MATYIQEKIKFAGIAACVPPKIESNNDNAIFTTKEEAEKFMSTTGVVNRRIAESDVCTSDLCFKAASELIKKLNWNVEDIGVLIFVTQTPDFHGPMNSTIMQDRLGLSKSAIVFDIPVGCSGYVYGTSVISAMMNATGIKKGLLLVGDTLSKQASPRDKSTQPLMGDAGAATAFEFTGSSEDKICFDLGNDGSGFESLYVKEGGCRFPFNESTLNYVDYGGHIVRNGCHTIMDGMDVFTFGISTAPQTFRNVLATAEITNEEIDYAIFHQANKFMNEKIRKKLNLTPEQVPYCLEYYGNTSSATIPLTITSELQEKVQDGKLNIMMCGFGIGLSWGTMYTTFDKIVCLPVIDY